MKKKLFKIGIKLIAFLLSLNAFAQADPVFTALNPATDQVTITNIGDASVDIGAYQLCTTGFVYSAISSLTTEDTDLGAGDSITVTWAPIPDATGGTLILFTNRSFGSTDPTVLRDYMRWGTTANFRTSNGVASGRWSNDSESITCPAPYSTGGTRGGNPIAWGDADGGTISMNAARTTELNVNGTTRIDGDLAVSICVDGRPDPIAVAHVTQATNRSYLYVITDNSAEETILNIVAENEISLDGAGAGTCKIWGWSYSGLGGRDGALATFGGGPLQDLRDANCSSVSEQFITVVREEAIGGTVAIDLVATGNPNGTTSFNGDTEAVICIDAQADPIIVTHSNPGAENLSYRYVITDAATGLILNVVNSNSIDLNGVAPGTCEIWGWSYRGVEGNGLNQVGQPLSSLDDLDCSDISDIQITIIREAAIGGTVAIDLVATGNPNGTTSFNGDTEAVICIDSLADPIVVTHSNPGAENLSYRYVITDAATGLILNVVNSNSIDLNGVAPGTCEIWGWSYRGVEGNGLNQIGQPLSSLDDLDCSDISDNQITIIREAAIGGTVAIDTVNTTDASGTTTVTDATTATIIVGDAIANPIVVTHSNPGAENLSYRYVITDAATGLILNVVNTNTIDLNGVAAGTCEIWGWSYRGVEGNGLSQVGLPLSSLDDLDCSDISDNQITVERIAEVNGDADPVFTALNPATDEVTITNIGDASVDIGAYQLCTTGFVYSAISSLTTESTVLGAGDSITVTWAPIPDATGGTLILFTNRSFGSTDPTVLRDYMRWGTTANFRTSNGVASGRWSNDSESITCPAPYSTGGTRGGNPIAWGDADGGTISMNAARTTELNVNGTTRIDGDLAVSICVDGRPDPIAVEHITQATNRSYLYVITDNSAEETILNIVAENEISLDGAGAGTCRIWGWSYSGLGGRDGALATFGGGPLQDMRDANCSSVSEQFITVVREEAIGGTVAIDLVGTGNPNGTTSFNGDTEAVICIDSLADPIVVTHSNPGAENLSYRYVITDAATGLILNVVNSNSIDLNGVAPGTCEIWGWSYRGVEGNGLNQVGQPLSSLDDLDCSDISDNQITIIREAAIGGTVAIDLVATGNPNGTTSFNGDTEAVICIDSLADPIVVTHSNPGAENLSYRYVITDAATGLILNVVNSNSIDLNGVAPGTCEIWGWSYRGVEGNGLNQVGQPLSSLDDLDCSDISDNQITIIREAAIGGTVAIDTVNTSDASGTTTVIDATTATIIVGDAIANPIVVTHSNPGAENLSYRYVITDAATGLILNVVNTDTIDLNGVAAGTCEIWGWSYRGVEGNGLNQVGQPLSSLDDLDCSDISDNQITVIREAANVISVQNFIVRAIGESCETSNDGSISISASEEFSYTATINGISLDNTSEVFTSETTFENLEAGEYSVCITVAEISEFEQCFTLVVSEPQNLEVIENFENSAKELNLQLAGGELYEINLNGEITFTAESEITLQLSEGENNFTVKTDKDCQGIFSNKIIIEAEDTFNVVPNPVQDNLNLIYTNSNNELVSVTLYDISGKRVETFTTTRNNEEASFNVSRLSAGIYFMNVEGTSTNVKILKK